MYYTFGCIFRAEGYFKMRYGVDVVCMHARDVGTCLPDCLPRTEFGVDALTCMQVSFWCVSTPYSVVGISFLGVVVKAPG